MIKRRAEDHLRSLLTDFPAVALLGPRQVGKTTLARSIAKSYPESIYLDLERPADVRRLDDPDAYLRAQRGRLVVLDEVHRVPALFEVLRGVIDDARESGHRTGQFLLLGSASPTLMGMASESLAGRLAYLELAPIDPLEAATSAVPIDATWLRGGFPDSLLARTDGASFAWREAFVRTYLEREVPLFAPRVGVAALGRLWRMLAHNSGGILDAAKLASGLGVSGPTVTRYVELLVDLGLVRELRPWHANLGKRLVKRPKVFIRDTGLLHALVDVETMDGLLGHPVVGPSYESLVVETVINVAGPRFHPYFYRTSAGAEIDLILARGDKPVIAIEVKRSSAPTVSTGFRQAVVDLGIDHACVVYPGTETYSLKGGVEAVPLTDISRLLQG